ncbi:hypothetical protein [cf. Phormidesmis sp. LEGE 11477]|uniref:hypothetical protein n=1 Tax=cf. Phormidesmis sp. LEGE 11477 TaxID=1828680 RepID=UPI00188016D1|nr:hypothetical protein [cf. Phormidesmis sp. LEGE 11477]MBE9065035.1 hypothetical protein [cf. Phormidesmis sp. LEGE 11477]
MSEGRITNILADDPAVFEIKDSPKASSKEPTYAFHEKGYWAVRLHEDAIEQEARAQLVDPDLVRAIMYVENAHGASYGHFFEAHGVAETILPMNINPETWGDLVEEGADFSDALVNVRAGVTLISRIQERIEKPTVAKVASVYIFTGRENVNDYGARVAEVYAKRMWQQVPRESANPLVNEAP